MTLTSEEERIIRTFRREAEAAFPGEILEVWLFGSKARGDATEDSDIDVLVITASDDWRRGDAIRRIGYALDAEIGCRLSIQVLPVAHMRYLRDNRFQFTRNIEREGVAL